MNVITAALYSLADSPEIGSPVCDSGSVPVSWSNPFLLILILVVLLGAVAFAYYRGRRSVITDSESADV